jgi:hypothetical protein
MLMRTVEPFAQVRGGFVGRLPVKGHHRCGDARDPDDMGAPAFFGDPRHLNDKGSPGNSSFESMAHDVFSGNGKEKQQRFYGSGEAKQAKGSTKAERDRAPVMIRTEY